MASEPKQKTVAEKTLLYMQQSKNALEKTARKLGWRGDPARTAKMVLATYCAQHGHEGDLPQPEQSMPQPQGSGGEQRSDERSQSAPQGSDKGAKSKGQQSGQQPQQPQSQGGGESGGDQQQDSAQQGEQQGEQQGAQSGGDKSEGGEQSGQQQGEQSEGEGAAQGQGDEGEGESQQQQQPPQPMNDADWKKFCAERGVNTPHPQLRKVYEIARQDMHSRKVNNYGASIYLKGEAGTGKTTLAGQLALLFAAPFNFISYTAGMSESQLSGWLLPVGDAGKFEYVPAPFVTRYAQGGVFLMDEIDASDPNTLLVLNSALANNKLAVPHNLEQPVVDRHESNIILAAGNTALGGGADERYSARNPLDAATSDRFIQIDCDYDPSYEARLFPGAQAAEGRAAWKPARNSRDVYGKAHQEFVRIRAAVESMKIGREVSTRFAQKLVVLLRAGFTLKDAVSTLCAFWSADERSRVDVKG